MAPHETTATATSVATVTPTGHESARTPRVKDDYLARVLAGEEFLLFDGAMGTQLQERGLAAGEIPELLCLTHPDQITEIHASYVAAGAQVVTTNTFGANRLKLGVAATVGEIVTAAVDCARASGARYVAADIGPTGALLQPMGTLPFDEAYELFAEQVRAADAAGADLFIIETMADLAEVKAAVLAAKENSDLPIFATMTFDEDGRTFLGTTPEVAAVTLAALGVDAVGINCSLGPADVAPLVERMLPWASCPVMVQANAGLPQVRDGRTTYDIDPDAYCAAVAEMLDAGVTIVGGCCGTSPAYTAGERALLEARKPVPALAARECGPCAAAAAGDGAALAGKNPAAPASEAAPAGEAPAAAGKNPAASASETLAAAGASAPARRVVRDDFAVTSAQTLTALAMGQVGVIGERINPTGKKKLKEALRSGNHDHVMSEAIAQTEAGAQVLDVNAGLPEIDERATLLRLVSELQGVTTLPLQIDSTDPLAIEAAVRLYPGKPIINSTNGKQEVLDAVLPIAKHYGCAVVALTLDEQGIPSNAEGRLAIARRIVAACDEMGIPRQDVVVDCLAMAASTDQRAPRSILDGIRLVKRELPGVRTVLGVSNISFGLPFRPLLNATFLAAAFAAGLDLAIVNPMSERLMDVVASWRVLSGEDEGSQGYVATYAGRSEAPGGVAAQPAAGLAVDVSSPEGVARTLDAMADALREVAGGLAASGAAAGAPSGGTTAEAPADRVAVDGGATPAAGSPAAASQVRDLVLSGRKGPVPDAVRLILADADAAHDTMYVINDVLIPALDEVGARFEKGTFFLPQLMASAEAAKAGFSTLRDSADASDVPSKGKIALATVKGDIHDIGKNIVRMLLENYGYDVIDLGRDVDPQVFVDCVVDQHIELAGLSALMTTTVPAMAETIELLHEQAPWCKVIVGGAVLNPEYAQMVGADFYAKDANESARIAGDVLG